MSNPPINEIFSDVTLTVDLTTFQRDENVSEVLSSYHLEKAKGTCYEFKGSFEEVEDVFWKLSVLKRSTIKNDLTHGRQDHSSTQKIDPVQVDGPVMDYINQKYMKELDVTVGNYVSLQLNRAHDKVHFHPLCTNEKDFALRCLFARERFITFYQNIATDLKLRKFDIDPTWMVTQRKYLEREFPKLMISSDSGRYASSRVSVTGSYADTLRFEDFVKNGGTMSQMPPSQRKQQTPRTVDRTSGFSTTQNLQKQEEDCPICLDAIKEAQKKTLPRCKHSFCRDCLSKAFESKPTCPVCGTLYGSLKGTQPDNGTMTFSTNGKSLPGNDSCGSIVIRYDIPDGTQGEEHPNPGQGYTGACRTAFLPDSDKGRKVLKLLQRAFEQRLIFTIGQSSTTGRSNMVTWNDIHHKTSRTGGPTNYGYPDPDYLDRVQDELKTKGIY